MARKLDWIREYELFFTNPKGSIMITSVDIKNPLDVKFAITADPKNMAQSTMELSVFGLKESNVAFLTEFGGKVFFKVGYRGQALKTLYVGELIKVRVESDATKHETKITCRASRVGSKPMTYKFQKGTTHAGRILLMLQEAKKLIPELVIGEAIQEINQLSADESLLSKEAKAKLPNKTYLNDTVKGTHSATNTILEELAEYCSTFKIELAFYRDEVHFVRQGGTVNTNEIIIAQLGENLLTVPRRRMDNTGATATTDSKFLWDMKMMLTPEISLNTSVEADYVRNNSGTIDKHAVRIKTTELKHMGHYRGNDWYTVIAGTDDQNFIVDVPILSVADEFTNTYVEPVYDISTIA